ncbi:MAG: hypothetical protein WAL70_15765 [Aeromicrobium sp.]
MITGVLAMLVALLSGSSDSNSDNPAQASNRKDIEPVAPIDPQDATVQKPSVDEPLDLGDPFAVSFGKSGLRKVNFTITGNGAVNFSVSYRDHKGDDKRQINGSYSKTRKVRGRYPLIALAVQLPPKLPGGATRATCTVTIDGVEVDKKSTTKAGYLLFCIA